MLEKGTRVVVYFYDGKGISKRPGWFVSIDEFFVFIKTNINGRLVVEGINKKNIVRMVVIDGS